MNQKVASHDFNCPPKEYISQLYHCAARTLSFSFLNPIPAFKGIVEQSNDMAGFESMYPWGVNNRKEPILSKVSSVHGNKNVLRARIRDFGHD